MRSNSSEITSSGAVNVRLYLFSGLEPGDVSPSREGPGSPIQASI